MVVLENQREVEGIIAPNAAGIPAAGPLAELVADYETGNLRIVERAPIYSMPPRCAAGLPTVTLARSRDLRCHPVEPATAVD